MATTLTDEAVMAAVYDRGGNPVTLKTLSELDGLGRPNIGALRSLCGRLVNEGHLRPAGKTREGLLKAVRPTDKMHEGAAELRENRVDAENRTTESKGAEKALRQELLDNGLLDKAVYQARCAWTQDDHDRYLRVSEKLTAWVTAKVGDNPPRDVVRRVSRMQDRCYCWSCRADTIEKFVREDALERKAAGATANGAAEELGEALA